MKKKTTQLIQFIDKLHEHIIKSPQFRKNTAEKSEKIIQTEIRPLIIQFLEEYFREKGYVDYIAKANNAFYWEGQEGNYGYLREPVFAGNSRPDYIITEPYWIAIEYKKGSYASSIKQAIGQAIMYTLSEEFDYAYILFQDESKDKKIKKSIKSGEKEKGIINIVREKFNVFLMYV